MDVSIEGKTIGEVFCDVVSLREDRPFVSCEGEGLTYAEMRSRVDEIARGLLACGVRKGDKVSLWAGNSVEWVAFYLAAVSIGAVLVPVNTRYHVDELRYQLRQSDTRFLVMESGFLKENFLERILEAVPEVGARLFGAINSEDFPCFEGVILIDDAELSGSISLEGLISLGEHTNLGDLAKARGAVFPEDVALMIYTSGTTGEPKGVMQQHFALLNRMHRYCCYNNMGEDDATFFALPLFHSFGAVVAVLGTIVTGSRLCMLRKFQPRAALELIQKERCSVIHGVPSSFYMMLREPGFELFDLSCGRTGVLGGSFCPPDLSSEIMDRIAPGITNAWGQTESCGMVTASASTDTAEQVCTTIGRVIPGSTVKIVHPDTLEERQRGERGEIVVFSPYNMLGYYRMEEATREAFRGGCLHTGDIGYFDDDGCLRIDGRIKDMFIVGGVNTYPCEIENHIRTIEGVADVQVVGVPDERLGEVACAYVVKESGSSLDEQGVIEKCRDLANYKVPRYVRFVDEYPTTANGKVKKYVLREMFSRDLQRKVIE